MSIVNLEQISGMNSHYRYYTLDDFFGSMQKLGLHSVEIWSCGHHYLIDADSYQSTKALMKKAKGYGLKIICLTPEQNNPKPHNLASKDAELKKRTLKYFKNAIQAANELDCRNVLVTSGWALYSEDIEEAWKRSVEMIQQLCLFAQESNVVLAMETLMPEESRLVTDINSLKRMLNEVNSPALKVTLDLGAMANAGECIQDYFDAFGEKVVHSHFVDDGPTDHLAWGDGTRDMKSDFEIFQKNGYTGHFSLEYVNERYYENPFQADIKTIEKLRPYL